jgi:Oxidoreductase family, NAD-binding Rossmann fold
MKRRPVGIGIIGGGLMGRESASAFARWRTLTDVTVEPQLVGVADLNPAALEWFDDGRTFLTRDYRELLDRDEIEILYVAVPHNLHAEFTAKCWKPEKICWPRSRSASTSRRRTDRGRGAVHKALCSLQLRISVFAGAATGDPNDSFGTIGPGPGGEVRLSPFERLRPHQDGQLEAPKRGVR